MRVLLVTDQVGTLGGAEAMTLSLRDGLRRAGHDARIFSSTIGLGADPSLADYHCWGTTSALRTALQVFNPIARRRLHTVLRTFNPDVVHVRVFLSQLSPSILPLLEHRPSLYHAVWPRVACPTGTKLLPDGAACTYQPGVVCYRTGCVPLRDLGLHLAQRRLWHRWRHVFGAVVANSRACRQWIASEIAGPVDVIWNGVPETPPRAGLAEWPTLSFAGRLIHQKGVDVLLAALAQIRRRVPAVKLLVAGDGPLRADLQALARRLDIDDAVEWLGQIPRSALYTRLSTAWVHVVPSRGTESFGLTAAEAMMRGTAVVASHVGALSEFIDAESGCLVPHNDVAALSAALLHFVTDRERAETTGRAARTRALRDLTEDRCVAKFVARYEALLEQGRALASPAVVGSRTP